MGSYVFLAVGRVGSSTDLIVQHVEYVQPHDKRGVLVDLLHSVEGLTLIFVETKRGADTLEDWLTRSGLPATSIHGDRTQQEREWALKTFRSGKTPYLVATDVAARGLDIPNVKHVINYDLPSDISDYTHRIGRTGRAGKQGLATALFTDKDRGIARSLAELMEESKQDVPGWLSNFAAQAHFGGGGGGRRRGGGGRRGGPSFGGTDSRFSGGSYQGHSGGGGAGSYSGYGGQRDAWD
jgi:ATP-dependent RNA helicase DDX3X